MSSIRILLYPISWSFILSSLRSLKAPGIISCSSGILIFPDRFHHTRMYSVFAPKPRPLPACSFLPAVFKAESNFYHRLMPHAQGHALFMPFSAFFLFVIPLELGLFMISFPVSGKMAETIFLPMVVSLKWDCLKEKRQGIVPTMSNIYVHFSQISFPVRYLVVNFQLESHSLRFREYWSVKEANPICAAAFRP